MRFSGKTAVVTGGAGGIGLATVQRLAAEGAAVVIADIDQAGSQAAEATARSAGARAAWASVCDVSVPSQVAATVSGTLERFGRLDVVVNNAGLMRYKSLVDLTANDWQELLGVDLLGAVYFTRLALQHMGPGGAIVNVSSVHAVETVPHVAPYAAAKAALLSLTRSTALEGRERGIRANALLPGAIDTPMLWENPNVKSGVEVIRQEDVGRPEDVAAAIAYLASDDARFVTGAALRVDGGRLGRL